MLVKDSHRRCTWEYLFNIPLNKEGDYTGEIKLYELDK